MRAICFWAVIAMTGCASTQPAKIEEQPTQAATTPTLEKSPDSGQVDRVGPSDGALDPDGTNDLGFITRIDGPISALFLLAVDESGKPTGTFQADTLVGHAESPPELGAKPGVGTAGLGVFDGEKALNAKDGSLETVSAGPHQLLLYTAPSSAVSVGTKLRVYALRPDKSLVAGNAVTN